MPVVCVTGQVPAALLGSDAFQETDITGITMPITKCNVLVERAEDVAPAMREALRIATSSSGPGLVDITRNAQQEMASFEPALPSPPSSAGWCGDVLALAQAADLMARAERPVILAGHGILTSGAVARCGNWRSGPRSRWR